MKPLVEKSSLRDEFYAVFYPKISALKSELFSLEKKKSVLRYLFTGKPYSTEINAKRKDLLERISEIEIKIPLDSKHELSRLSYKLDNCKRSLFEHEKALAPKKERLERQLKEKASQNEAQRKKMEELRAAAATAVEETRRLGAQIRGRLETQGICLYCGDLLGETYHADHIYPVSKGGRSIASNMVLVCVSCNFKKSDLTLSSFIRKFGLDREKIESRLTAMGKDF